MLQSEIVTTLCLWSQEIYRALGARTETRLVPRSKLTGLNSEDPPARERFGQDISDEGMDFPSSLIYRVPQMMAMIAHHS